MVLGEVTGVEKHRRHVLVSTEDRQGVRIEYDYLVLATGAQHSYFAHDEFERYAPGLKGLADAVAVWNKILRAFDLPPNWFPKGWHYQNFLTLFQSNVPFATFIWNSLEIAGAVTLAQLLTCSMAGYAFARLRFRGSKALFALLLTSLMMPIQVTIVPLFLMMSSVGLVDTHWAIILPLATNAFGIFMMRQFFLTVPRELIEAARIDGATQFATFWRIALPLAKPALASLGIITFVNTWNSYFLPLVFLNSWEK